MEEMEMEKSLINRNRSVIPALDGTYAQSHQITRALRGLGKIEAFKIGFAPALGEGLRKTMEMLKEEFGPEVVGIYDHQKAANDIPETGAEYARTLKNAGVQSGILFPFTGPETQGKWTKSVQDAGLVPIVGGIMTHPHFLVSEGGYIADDAPERIFDLAIEQDVRHFVVPGNKPEWVKKLYAKLVSALGEGNFTLYAPGFVAQGGDISESGALAGQNFHAIVGRGIAEKKTSAEMREAAIWLTRQL